MHWLARGICLLLAAALFVQGAMCLLRKDRLNPVGILNLLLATVGGFFCFSLRSGAIICSSELGILFTQGTWTTRLARMAIALLCICGGLCWLSTRAVRCRAQGWRFKTAILLIGLAIGATAWFQFAVIEGDVHLTVPLEVRYYSLWSFPLLWLLVCFSESILVLLNGKAVWDQIWSPALVIAPVALYGLGWQEIADPFTSAPLMRLLWIGTAFLAFPLAIGMSVWKWLHRVPSVVRWLIGGLVAAAAAVTLAYAGRSIDDQTGYQTPFLPLLGLWTVVAAVDAIIQVVLITRSVRAARAAYAPAHNDIALAAFQHWEARGRPPGSSEEDWEYAIRTLPAHRQAELYTPFVLAAVLGVVGLAVFDLFFLSVFAPGLDLLIAFAAWFTLTEFYARGAVSRIPLWLLKLSRLAEPGIASGLKKAGGWIVSWGRPAAPPASDDSAKTSTWAQTLKSAFKNALGILAAVVLLVVGSEVFNYGNTVVEPFTNPGDERLGTQLAQSIVVDLNRIWSDFPESVSLTGHEKDRPQQGGRGEPSPNITIGSGENSLGTAISGGNDVSLLGVKIPLGSIAAVVQGPVRRLFRVDQITGGLFPAESADGKTHFRAVAMSNRGAIWSADDFPAAQSADCPAQDKEPVETLAWRIALRIAADASDSGITQSEAAFQEFDQGIQHARRYELDGQWGELEQAISCFQGAIASDQTFAEARYRLALTLQKSGQPLRAADALLGLSRDKPGYVKGVLKRADIIYNLTYPSGPAVAPPISVPDASGEAELLLHEVAEQNSDATPVERRTAYIGLCLCRLDADRGMVKNKRLESIPRTGFYLPYYYCKRAEALRATAMPLFQQDGEAATLEAGVMNMLGNCLWIHNQRLRTGTSDSVTSGLYCEGPDAIDVSSPDLRTSVPLLSWTSPIGFYSIPYYAAAMRLAPDDTTFACNHASAELRLTADTRPMRALRRDSAQQFAIGNLFESAAVNAPASHPDRAPEWAALYFDLAVQNFESAVGLNPGSTDALNAYADGIWQWSLLALRRKVQGPTSEQLSTAEKHIRQALLYLSLRADIEQVTYLETTLAEVLLAEGKPEEAGKELAQLDGKVSRSPGAIEYYWARAQASVCAAKLQPDSAEAYMKQADNAVASLQFIENSSEFKPFASHPEKLEKANMERNCFPPAIQ